MGRLQLAAYRCCSRGFPTMQCGPFLLEPFEEQVLHGDYAHNIELLLLSEVTGVTGYYGNFTATIRQSPRFVAPSCIGCGMCVEACPASANNEFNCGMDKKKAIAMPFLGALPNLPYIDSRPCLRSSGDSCQLCLDTCPSVTGRQRADCRAQRGRDHPGHRQQALRLP
jgi:heterodisulfide reductase subunit A